jgi:hypothetical protein
MDLVALHDKARALGLGAMYQKHWARGGFRDLFDDQSPDWPTTTLAEKAIVLQAFESAGLAVAELIDGYRETLGREADGQRTLDRLPVAMWAYWEAGYALRLPDDLGRTIASITVSSAW